MTTTDYLQREIRRTELSIRRAERKPNTPAEELRGLHEKLGHLQEALEAVNEHWQRVHEQRGWTAGEPLTREQLIDMEGKPVLLKSPSWTEWCIVREHGEHEIVGDAINFTRRHRDVVCLGLADYGKTWTAYAYQTAHIDLDKWTAEWKEYGGADAGFHYCSKCKRQAFSYDDGEEVVEVLSNFCPWCGRPLTDEAWAELERRVFGG